MEAERLPGEVTRLPSERIIVMWHENASEESLRCWFRGIDSDGNFYGESRIEPLRDDSAAGAANGTLQWFAGRLPDDDNRQLRLAAEHIRLRANREVEIDAAAESYGFVAFGTYDAPELILRFRDDQELESWREFRSLIELLRPYAELGQR